jgi:hypothetical protein
MYLKVERHKITQFYNLVMTLIQNKKNFGKKRKTPK